MRDSTTIVQAPVSDLFGRPVWDCAGEKIGDVDELTYCERTRRLDWVAVQIGFIPTRRVLVPLQGARLSPEGLVVAVDCDLVECSPDVDEDVLTEDRERQLYEHYGLSPCGGRRPARRTGGREPVA